jgi:hypothetical protein
VDLADQRSQLGAGEGHVHQDVREHRVHGRVGRRQRITDVVQRRGDPVVESFALRVPPQLVERELAEVGGVHAKSLLCQEERVPALPGAELEDIIDACGTECAGRPARGRGRLGPVQMRMLLVRRLPTFLLSPRELDMPNVHVAPRVRHAGLDDRQTRSSLRHELSRRTHALARSGSQ